MTGGHALNQALTRLGECLEAVNTTIDRGTAPLVSAAVASMFLLVVAQVFCRYVLNAALVWAEEGARYLLIFTTFVGAPVAMRRGAHIAVTLGVELLPVGLRRPVEAGAQLLSCLVYGVMIEQGVALARQNFDQVSPALGLPLGAVYLVIPLGGLLLGLQALRRLASLAVSARPAAAALGVDGV
jgi:TRAP-type C4-dicarboxylate transport system permease small subunit